MEELNKLEIASLYNSENLHTGKFKIFLLELLKALCYDAEALSSDFWLFHEKSNEFEAIASYDAVLGQPGKKINLERPYFSQFIEIIKKNSILHIHHESEDRGLEVFKTEMLPLHGKVSWIGIHVLHDNKLFGLLAFRRKGLTEINQFEELLVITAASLISQSYDALLRMKEKQVRDREFDRLVAEKIDEEKEILIRKLTDHAFYTSHHIRHPLTTILALVDIIKISWEDRESYETYIRQLKIESMKLDDAIRVMTAKIELD